MINRVANDLENLEKSENLKETSESQGNLPERSGNLRQNSKSQGKVRDFCCLEVEDPNFENFLGSMPPDPSKWSRTHGRA